MITKHTYRRDDGIIVITYPAELTEESIISWVDEIVEVESMSHLFIIDMRPSNGPPNTELRSVFIRELKRIRIFRGDDKLGFIVSWLRKLPYHHCYLFQDLAKLPNFSQ